MDQREIGIHISVSPTAPAAVVARLPDGQELNLCIEVRQGSEHETAPGPDSTGKPVHAVVSHSSERERHADYCRKLCKVITKYLTTEEMQALGEHLEAFASDITRSRPAQGLHDATYHLRSTFTEHRRHADSGGAP